MARGYAGKQDQLAEIIVQAIQHKGLALVDILQPCVSFNKINTYQWYNQRCYKLPSEYDPTERKNALEKANEFGENIPLGIIYKSERTIFEEHFNALKKGPLYSQSLSKDNLDLEQIMRTYM